MKNEPEILVCIPVMDEMEYLPDTIQAIENQSFKNFRVFFCVNQPEEYRDLPGKRKICDSNAECLSYLSGISSFETCILDYSSAGKGWTGKKKGVGWARKIIMDKAAGEGSPGDIIMSLDADTVFNPGYFMSVYENFRKNVSFSAISVPYYHRLTNDKNVNRAILRYEIYLRYYFLNLALIKSPYAFTAIGSAMALKVSEYRKVKGITPHLSGEDFYFIEKLSKSKMVLNWNEEKVYPSARLSDRVFFGTGPALIKGVTGNWESYPIYPESSFNEIATTYNTFPLLYKANVQTPMSEFLFGNLKTRDLWDSLRDNAGSVKSFIRSCHQRIDGLKILQFLRFRYPSNTKSDEQNLFDFLQHHFPEGLGLLSEKGKLFSFAGSTLDILDKIRNFLCEVEDKVRKQQLTEPEI